MKNKLTVLALSIFGVSFVPFFASAGVTTTVTCGTSGDIQYIICRINQILGTIIPLLITLAVVVFIWGIISYVLAKEEEAKKEGRNKIIYGLIGLVVIVGLWGLVSIISSTFGIQNTTVSLPCAPGVPGC